MGRVKRPAPAALATPRWIATMTRERQPAALARPPIQPERAQVVPMPPPAAALLRLPSLRWFQMGGPRRPPRASRGETAMQCGPVRQVANRRLRGLAVAACPIQRLASVALAAPPVLLRRRQE